MKIVIPADSMEAEKATLAVKDIYGPASIRLAREATPVITGQDTPFIFGTSNIIRYREEKGRFLEAFKTVPSSKYTDEQEDITIITCGPMVAEAMRAAYILKVEKDIESRIINMHTVKPIDKHAIIKSLEETSNIITAEEHQVGGFGNIVAGVAASSKKQKKDLRLDMIGVGDRFGESGQPWELMRLFGLTGEFIAERAIKMLSAK